MAAIGKMPQVNTSAMKGTDKLTNEAQKAKKQVKGGAKNVPAQFSMVNKQQKTLG